MAAFKLSSERLLPIALLAFPSAGVYLSRGTVIFLPFLVAILFFIAKQNKENSLPKNLSAPAYALLLAIGWAAASLIWSGNLSASAAAAGKTIAVGLLGLFGMTLTRGVKRNTSNHSLWAITVGVVIGLALLVQELVFDGTLARLMYELTKPEMEPFRLSRGVAIVAVFTWIAFVGHWQRGRRVLAVGLVALAYLVIKRYDGATTTYGLLGATLGFMVIRWLPVVSAWAATALAALSIVAMPIFAANLDWLIAYPGPGGRLQPLYDSLHMRFYIWDFVQARMFEQPIIGWGIDASRFIPGGSDPMQGFKTNVLPLHPHNVILQWWLELGAIGAVLFGAAVTLTLVTQARRTATPDARAAAVMTVFFLAAFGMISFGMWQSWWMSLIAICAIMVATLEVRPLTET